MLTASSTGILQPTVQQGLYGRIINMSGAVEQFPPEVRHGRVLVLGEEEVSQVFVLVQCLVQRRERVQVAHQKDSLACRSVGSGMDTVSA